MGNKKSSTYRTEKVISIGEPGIWSPPREESIQEAAAVYLDRHPATRGLWFHPPNEGKRSGRYAAKLQRQGVKAGVPDIVVLRPPGLCIELKTAKGRVRKTQQAWAERLEAVGVRCIVCRSMADVVAAVEEVYGD